MDRNVAGLEKKEINTNNGLKIFMQSESFYEKAR
jgi:hypothetical protein